MTASRPESIFAVDPADTLFLVWGPPSHGPRSRVFADALGVPIRFVEITKRRGALAAVVKYPGQTLVTLWVLARRRPRTIFVQSPPSMAVLVASLYCSIRRGGAFVVDAHSDAFLSPIWSRPRWLVRWLARRALVTVVTNEHFAAQLSAWGGRALVVRDVPATYPDSGRFAADAGFDPDGFNVAVVSTFASDEPLTEVLSAAAELPAVTFHVTGDTARAPAGVVDGSPANVNYTGFLSREDYYALMRGSQAVMCLTTRDHTMQRGACEALALGRPIITSDWPLLRTYFDRGTVHVDNTVTGIHDGVDAMVLEHQRYEREIEALQVEQRRRWGLAASELAALLAGRGDRNSAVSNSAVRTSGDSASGDNNSGDNGLGGVR